jgi:hypothetical protein
VREKVMMGMGVMMGMVGVMMGVGSGTTGRPLRLVVLEGVDWYPLAQNSQTIRLFSLLKLKWVLMLKLRMLTNVENLIRHQWF